MVRPHHTPSGLLHATPTGKGPETFAKEVLRWFKASSQLSDMSFISNLSGKSSGFVEDLATIAAAFRGVYGAWVNTDGFTIGEQKEIYAGMRIFEVAKQTPSMRHYVWSSLDYALKVSSSPTAEICAANSFPACRRADIMRNTAASTTVSNNGCSGNL